MTKKENYNMDEMFAVVVKLIKETVLKGETINPCAFFMHRDDGVSSAQPFMENQDINNAFYDLGLEAKRWNAHQAVVILNALVKRFDLDQFEYVKNNLATSSPETYPESMRDEGVMIHRFNFENGECEVALIIYKKDDSGEFVLKEQVIKNNDTLGTSKKFSDIVKKGYEKFNQEADNTIDKIENLSEFKSRVDIPGLMDFSKKIFDYQNKLTKIFDIKKLIDDLSKTIIKGYQKSGKIYNLAFICNRDKGITPPIFIPGCGSVPIEEMIEACGAMCANSYNNEIVLFIHCSSVQIEEDDTVDFDFGIQQFPDKKPTDGVVEIRYFIETDKSENKFYMYKIIDNKLHFFKTIASNDIMMVNISKIIKNGIKKGKEFIERFNGSFNDNFTDGPDLNDHLKPINPEDLI